jgi:hypothetical protein
MVYDVAKDWVDAFPISDPDGSIVAEFRANPIGHHSPALQRVLLKMRIDPRSPRYVLFCRTPHKEWLVGRMGKVLGDPVELDESKVYNSIEEAEQAVFNLRWKILTGHDLA